MSDLDTGLVDDFIQLMTTTGVDHAKAIALMAEHPKEAYAAIDGIVLRTHHVRQAVRGAVAKLEAEKAKPDGQ